MRNHDTAFGITTISNIRIFDGTRLLDADSVVLHDGLIDEVGRGLGAGGESFDGRGGTLIGLIDAHTHAFPAVSNRRWPSASSPSWTCSPIPR